MNSQPHFSTWCDAGTPAHEREAVTKLNFTRRTMLSVLPAVAVISNLPAIVSAAALADHPDAEIFRIGQEFDVAAKNYERISRLHDEAHEIWARECPVPDALWRKPEDVAHFGDCVKVEFDGHLVTDHYRADDMPMLYVLSRILTDEVRFPHLARAPYAARAEEIVLAFKDYNKKSAAVAAKYGYDELESMLDEAYDRTIPILRRACSVRATTFEGVAAKMKMGCWLTPDEPDDRMLESIMIDLLETARTDEPASAALAVAA